MPDALPQATSHTGDGPDAPAQRSLDHKLVKGVAWTAAAKWGNQLISWASVVLLARLLTPDDYGLVGMGALYLGLIAVLTEGGLGTSIIAMDRMTRDEVAQLNSVAAVMGLAGAVATCAAAYPLGLFFGNPKLPPLVMALSANAVLSSLRLAPVAVMQRELRFRGLAVVEGLHAFATTASTLAFALLGWRYWALVGGGIVGNLVTVVASRLLSPVPFGRPRRGSIGQYFHFTRDVLVGRIAWYVYTNADFVVAGRTLGSAALGAYSFAWNIASVPVEKVTALVTRVTPAFFSRLKADRAELTRILLNVTEGLVLLTLPASVGMAVVADDFVRVYLGPTWEETIGPLRLLALYATFRSVVTLFPQVLTMLGHTRFLMLNGIATAIALPIAFMLGSRWGAVGIASMWIIAYPVFIVPLYRRAFAALGLTWSAYWAAIWPQLRAALVMLAALLALRQALPDDTSTGFRLLLQIAVGGIVFLIVGLLPQRERFRRLIRLLRSSPTAATTTLANANGK